MADGHKQHPATAEESDISKAISQQRPPAQARQHPEKREPETDDLEESDADQPDEGLQGETRNERRTDVEGTSLEPERP